MPIPCIAHSFVNATKHIKIMDYACNTQPAFTVHKHFKCMKAGEPRAGA